MTSTLAHIHDTDVLFICRNRANKGQLGWDGSPGAALSVVLWYSVVWCVWCPSLFEKQGNNDRLEETNK